MCLLIQLSISACRVDNELHRRKSMLIVRIHASISKMCSVTHMHHQEITRITACHAGVAMCPVSLHTFYVGLQCVPLVSVAMIPSKTTGAPSGMDLAGPRDVAGPRDMEGSLWGCIEADPSSYCVPKLSKREKADWGGGCCACCGSCCGGC